MFVVRPNDGIASSKVADGDRSRARCYLVAGGEIAIDRTRLVEYVVLGLVAVVLIADVRPRLARWADQRWWARPWMEPLVVSVAVMIVMAPGFGSSWFLAAPAALIAFGAWVAVRSARGHRETSRSE